MDFLLVIGDIVHILALFLLIFTIKSTTNVLGISYKMHQIYLVVFITRYSDMIIFDHKLSNYFAFTRILLIGLTILIIYYIKIKQPYAQSYYREYDSLFHYHYYFIALIIMVVMHQNNTAYGYLRTFSICLEPTTIIPQNHMLKISEQTQNFPLTYIILLGVYRLFYILHWIVTWQDHNNLMPLLSAFLQLVLYILFICRFTKMKNKGKLYKFPI